MNSDILIIDDEVDIRNLIQGVLQDEGYETRESSNSEQAYKMVADKLPGIVILDIWLQGSQDDGLQILKTLKAEYPDLPIVMISGHGTIETAVTAIKDGAYDFIEKPFKSDRLIRMVERALETAQLRRENARLKKGTAKLSDELICHSAAMQGVQQLIERTAPANSRVLIKGQAGTGKDIVARLIHKNSLRKNEVFVGLNCATLRPESLELELFGKEGEDGRVGILEQAHGGTLVLDEVADMPLETQGKIVRVLQEQQFQRIGGTVSIQTDIRILATTNRDLEQAIEKGDFREDLFYRLNVVQIEVPPLKKRKDDLEELTQTFLANMLKQSGCEEKQFSSAALLRLRAYDWPGNVRQLKNVIEWVCIMHGGQSGEFFEDTHLPPEITGDQAGSLSGHVDQGGEASSNLIDMPLREAREGFEKKYLIEQIKRFDGNVSKTAKFIGMERSALHRKLKSLQINLDKDLSENMSQAENVEKQKRA